MILKTVSHPIRHVAAISVALVAAFGGVVVLTGCGSTTGGKSSGITTPPSSRSTGTATLTVQWPERKPTRLIPKAANSIKIVIVNPGDNTILATTLIVRPAGDTSQTSTTTVSRATGRYPFCLRNCVSNIRRDGGRTSNGIYTRKHSVRC